MPSLRAVTSVAARVIAAALTSVTVLSATACGSHDPELGPASSGSATRPSASAAVARSVTISVDGAAVAEVQPSQLTTRKRLVDLVPGASSPGAPWRSLEAHSGKRTIKLRELDTTYADQDACLFLDASSQPSIGMFRRTTEDMPPWMMAKLSVPTVTLDAVEALDLRTKERDVLAGVTVELAIRGGEKRALSDADLGQLREKGRGDGDGGARKQRRQGTPLARVIEIASPLAEVLEVVATSPDRSVTITGAELRAKSFAGSLRRNRRGQLVLRVGEDTELRGVTGLEIIKNGAPTTAP